MKNNVKSSMAALYLLLISGFASAAYPENPTSAQLNTQPADPSTCFQTDVVKRGSPANLSSFGGFAVDVQYVNIEPNQKCHVLINDAAMKQLFSTGNVSSAFASLGNQTSYGSYTVMGIPKNDRNVVYKIDSNHIITNSKAGDPSDVVRFEMLGNNPNLDTRSFNIVLRMKTITGQVDSSGQPIRDSFTFNISENFKIGYRNYFLFSRGNQLIYVNVYPLKYPLPKR